MLQIVLEEIVAILKNVAMEISAPYSQIVRALLGEKEKKSSLSQRVKQLSDTLIESETILEELRKELSETIESSKKVQSEINELEKIKKINENEVETVLSLIENTNNKNKTKDAVRDIIINIIFMFLGAGLSILIDYLISK